MLKNLFNGLAKTRASFVNKVKKLFAGRKIDEKLLQELEELLIYSDVGVKTTEKLLVSIKNEVKKNPTVEPMDALKNAILEIFNKANVSKDLFEKISLGPVPYVIFVVGVNGVGKTTTIAKLAHIMKRRRNKVMITAADTFRAAAVEQLDIWAQRIGVDIVKGHTGSDPSAVIFDSIKAGEARGIDVIIADTAGRLHTKANLMEELKKMKRVADKACPGAPHEVLMVLDATIGQNAVVQARIFNEAVDISGLVLTKVDSSAKGGVILPIIDELNIPIYFLGVGEKEDDLLEFNSTTFIDELFR